MEKPAVAPNDAAALPDETAAGEDEPAAKRVRAPKSGTKKAPAKKATTKKASIKKAPTKKASTKNAPAKKTAAKQAPVVSSPAAEIPAETAPTAASPTADVAKAGGMAWPLHGVSETTGYLAAAAASKEGVPVEAWVERTLAEAANRTLSLKSRPLGSAEDLLPSIGELSQKLEVLRHAIGNEDSAVAKLAGHLKNSADEMATSLGQRIKTAAEKAPPLDEVTNRLKQSVRYAREHAALDDVASKWREHVDNSKWREHVRQARDAAGGVFGEVKGKAGGAIEELWNRQSRNAENQDQNEERQDRTGPTGQ